MTTIREAAQQALEALEYAQQGRECPSTTRQAITALKAALAEPQANTLHGWVFKRNEDGTVGIFAPPPRPGESQRTSDCVGPGQRDLHELLGKLADHMAALEQPFSPEAIRTTQAAWKMGYEARKAEEQPEPDSPERRCGGPGCDLKCCQPVAQRGAMFHTHPAVERQRSVEAAVRPACGVDPAAKAEPVQEPMATMTVREDMGADFKFNRPHTLQPGQQFYLCASPPQRKPLSEDEKRALADKFLSCQPESYEVSGVFDLISAVERAHGIGGEG